MLGQQERDTVPKWSPQESRELLFALLKSIAWPDTRCLYIAVCLIGCLFHDILRFLSDDILLEDLFPAPKGCLLGSCYDIPKERRRHLTICASRVFSHF